jgi:YVTN family beta-propeller protein
VECESLIETSQSADVMVVNEGNFGWGNGSLSLYRPQDKIVSNNVFSQANNSVPLGDVVQSAFQYNERIYVVANNSSKIEIIDEASFVSIATITGFNSPRYFLPINASKAYVSDLYSSSIQIVDINSKSINGSISANGWTEKMLLYEDTAYVCEMSADNVLLINTTNDLVLDSIKVGIQPNSLVIDKNNKIWVLCDGGFNESLPQLLRINPQTRQIEVTLSFQNLSDSPNNLCINSSKDQLYFLNSDLFKMKITDLNLPTIPIFSGANKTFYGLGLAPNSDNIYVADAVDYVQNGQVYRLDSIGNTLDQFSSGIIPGNFLFLE